jgi:hypothetical protein
MTTESKSYLIEYMRACTGRDIDLLEAFAEETEKIPDKGAGITMAWPNSHIVYYLSFSSRTGKWTFEEA